MTKEQQLIEALSLTSRHASQVSPQFIRGMASRMAMSYENYGDVKEAYPLKMNAVESAILRIERYNDTGNAEYLIDAANFLMIEFMLPLHMNAHFKPEDSKASPGRITTKGKRTHEANTVSRENIRKGGTKAKTSGGYYKREGD
jgi:hypothetical protein